MEKHSVFQNRMENSQGSFLYANGTEYKPKLIFGSGTLQATLFDFATTACSPFSPAPAQMQGTTSPPCAAKWLGRVAAALMGLGWRCARQIGAEQVPHPKEQRSKPPWEEQQALLLSMLPADHHPPCSSQSKVFPRCYNLPLPGIRPAHPCEDSWVFKAETAKEYIQESLIKATILCTMEHPSRKCAELVPQNNYMCRVHCKHSFCVHQHSWGQCLKI